MESLLWVYVINAVLLINHEIDSAYWKEWELFRIPGGITVFLLLHFPLLFFVLYGLVEVSQGTHAGLVCSAILGAAGVFAFGIHMFFLARGRMEFRSPMSIFILCATLTVSVAQLVLTARLWWSGWQL
jgi:hypothetical protein